jgi:polo-like kinase 4
MLENYDIGQVIGRGGFAYVYRARHRITLEEVAIKIIDKRKLNDVDITTRLNGELRIHSQMQHNAIARVFDFFEDANCAYIVMEFCPNGNLYRRLRTLGYMNEKEAARITYSILSAIKYMHDLGIIHRDLKMSNILLDANDNVKICDFGLAVQLEHPDEEHFTLCGTPNYIAPEIISKQSYSYPADIWSVGCIFYYLLIGHAPFDTNDAPNTSEVDKVKSTLANIVQGKYSLPQNNSLSEHAIDLMQSMLNLVSSILVSVTCILLISH